MQQGEEYKIYSPNTALWIPSRINSFLTNNQPKHNTSGHIGVSWNKQNNKWIVQICDFETGKYTYLGLYKKIEDANKCYFEYRAKNAEKVKDYLRSLNYLPEDIIELVR